MKHRYEFELFLNAVQNGLLVTIDFQKAQVPGYQNSISELDEYYASEKLNVQNEIIQSGHVMSVLENKF